jgi:hypothetical protein
MSSENTRRNFIRKASLISLSLGVLPSLPAGILFGDKSHAIISNDYFSVWVDEKTGLVTVYRSNGAILLYQASVRINLSSGKKSASGGGYVHSLDVRKVENNLGSGSQLVIFSRDREKQLDITISYTLYDRLSTFFVNASCKNVSGKQINIRSIEPICATEETGASVIWQDANKILTNGPMYYDAGMVYNIGDTFTEPTPYGPIKGGNLSPDFEFPSGNRIRSWWNAAIFSGYDKEGMVCGFVDNHTGLGQIILSKTTEGKLSLYTESVFAPGTQLRPGNEISSGRFAMNIARDPYYSLEAFADIMGNLNGARSKWNINGWCNWFYTYEFITEEEVIRNAEFASRHLRKYGLEYIQVDEGYQRYHGDWEGNERFPHGMKWLAGTINDLGLKPGIWLAPFVISEPTEVYAKHPEWLLKHSDGRLMRVGPWPDEDTDWARNENPRRYGLDVTHPDARKWLYDLFSNMAGNWGYQMFKIDFVAWSLLSAYSYYDQSYTPAMAYRKAMETIRSAVGNKSHINDCGPGPVTVGLIDSMRIESDQNYGFADAAWKQYFLESSSSAPAAAKRYYFNERTWTNDADHVCISLLSVNQARAAATLIALTGGNVISGDRLIDLDITRIEILKKIYPAWGTAARPVDLFDNDRQAIFSLNVKKPFGEWTVVGLFNPGMTGQMEKTIPLERLRLDMDKTYIAYDFWLERLFGEVKGDLIVSLQPESVTLLSIHEKGNRPQVISTDRHVLQGACETDDINWNEETKTLGVISSGPSGCEYNVMIYLPDGISWKQDRQMLVRDFENYSVRPVGRQLLKVHLRFSDTEKLRWQLSFL